MNMKLEIKYFGMIAEKLGKEQEFIDFQVENLDKSDLKSWFIQRFPDLKKLSFVVAVNESITNELPDGEIKSMAVLPPFAGG